ncbi:MAG: serine hydrolase [Eubacterium sp.]
MGFIDRDLIEREMKYWRIPGAGFAAVGDGFPTEYECFGLRDIENRLPFDEDTLFCIASCSKSMTAEMIGSLVAEGVLDFDRPISEYLPEFQLFDPEASKNFTLRDMLCHRTGFGANDVLWPCDRADLAKRIRYVEPCGVFRDKSLYSNVIYALIGYVAEAVTGKSWPQLMQEYVFDPIHMDATSCTAEKMLAAEDRAIPYYVEEFEPVRKEFWNIDGGGPAASVNTTIKDFAKWLKFNIAGGVNEDGVRVIPEAQFREIHSPQMYYKDFIDDDKYPCHYYCMGWRYGEYRGHRFLKHSGKIEGFSSFQVYLPDEKVGVCMMANIHTPATEFEFSMTYSILDAILREEPKDWAHAFRPKGAEDAAHAPLECYLTNRENVAALKLCREIDGLPPNHALSDFAGEYANPGHGPASVRFDAGENRLYLHYRDQEFPLRHYGADSFVMDGVLTDTLTLSVPVTFVSDEFGDVIKVKICYEKRTNDIVFVKKKTDGGEK